jgi:VanZ family protein
MIGFLINLAIEVLQAFLPSRDSSMMDLIANSAGAGIGSILFLKWVI